MAFSVADLTSKNNMQKKKTISKDQKSILAKYKISSAYEYTNKDSGSHKAESSVPKVESKISKFDNVAQKQTTEYMNNDEEQLKNESVMSTVQKGETIQPVVHQLGNTSIESSTSDTKSQNIETVSTVEKEIVKVEENIIETSSENNRNTIESEVESNIPLTNGIVNDNIGINNENITPDQKIISEINNTVTSKEENVIEINNSPKIVEELDDKPFINNNETISNELNSTEESLKVATSETVEPQNTFLPSAEINPAVNNIPTSPEVGDTAIPEVQAIHDSVMLATPDAIISVVPEAQVAPNVIVSGIPEVHVTPNVTVADTPEIQETSNVTVADTPEIQKTSNVAVTVGPEVQVVPNESGPTTLEISKASDVIISATPEMQKADETIVSNTLEGQKNLDDSNSTTSESINNTANIVNANNEIAQDTSKTSEDAIEMPQNSVKSNDEKSKEAEDYFATTVVEYDNVQMSNVFSSNYSVFTIDSDDKEEKTVKNIEESNSIQEKSEDVTTNIVENSEKESIIADKIVENESNIAKIESEAENSEQEQIEIEEKVPEIKAVSLSPEVSTELVSKQNDSNYANKEEIDTSINEVEKSMEAFESETSTSESYEFDDSEEDEDATTDFENSNGYIYGEADPDQFVYYHRKDIRLKLHTGEKRDHLLQSIRVNGIHEPILVRKAKDNKFEIIAGHNRHSIASELGIKVPYLLLPNVSDDYADQICVDTNLLNRQHNEMLPSELSNMLMVKRKMFTLERVADEFHIASTTMKSFLKLQDLLPELLYEWVDTKKIGMTVGYALACSEKEQQQQLLDYLKGNNIKSISVKQGREITNRGKLAWDDEFLDKVFGNERIIDPTSVKPQTKVSMTYKELGKYLNTNDLQDAKKTICDALSLKKKINVLLDQNNTEYSNDLIVAALENYLSQNN